MTDAPRRRRLDPLRVFVGLVLLAVFALVATVVLRKRPAFIDEEVAAAMPTDKAIAVALPPAEMLATLEKKPVTTSKGKLLKSALKKRAEREVSNLKKTKVATAGSIDVVLTGDSGLRRMFQKQLAGVRVVNDGARGFQLSLRIDTGSDKGDAVFAKCSAAISELPNRKLLASLSMRADAGGDGDGSDREELKTAAIDACAGSLADDVSKWMRAHR